MNNNCTQTLCFNLTETVKKKNFKFKKNELMNKKLNDMRKFHLSHQFISKSLLVLGSLKIN